MIQYYKYTLAIITMLIMYSCHPKSDEVLPMIYTEVSVDTVQLEIEKRLNESSGLVLIDGRLWTHNDSGGEPILYQLDSTGTDVTKSVSIAAVKNNDWEEITRDSHYVYIGNFGNNLGARKNLEIYKVSVDTLNERNRVTPEIIKFHYPEQTSFPGSYNHNFDCEAFVAIGDSLYLFTKNWQDQQCSIYAVPKASGDYPARLISTMNTKGVITSATSNTANNEIIILGYNLDRGINTFYPFIWRLSDYNGTDFFSGSAERYNLSIKRQAEAITWIDGNRYYVSAENENSGHASLYELSISELIAR